MVSVATERVSGAIWPYCYPGAALAVPHSQPGLLLFLSEDRKPPQQRVFLREVSDGSQPCARQNSHHDKGCLGAARG